MDDAPEVDAQHPFPVVMGGGLEASVDGDARVVAEDVDTAELLPGALRERLDRRERADVRPHGDGLDARLLDARGGLGHAGLVQIRRDDVGALAGEGEAERAPG